MQLSQRVGNQQRPHLPYTEGSSCLAPTGPHLRSTALYCTSPPDHHLANRLAALLPTSDANRVPSLAISAPTCSVGSGNNALILLFIRSSAHMKKHPPSKVLCRGISGDAHCIRYVAKLGCAGWRITVVVQTTERKRVTSLVSRLVESLTLPYKSHSTPRSQLRTTGRQNKVGR
jgi:hypothetical protein